MTTATLTANNLNDLAKAINDNARAKGFWEADRDLGEMLMLAVSELSEALEEHRAGQPARYLMHAKDCSCAGEVNGGVCPFGCTPKPEGTAVELADCIIRCLDTMHSLVVDIDEEVADAREVILLGARVGFSGPLPENFAAALKNITHALCKVEHAYALDQPGWLAYAIVRCFELIERTGEEVTAVVAEKMAYNATRPYRHGKAY